MKDRYTLPLLLLVFVVLAAGIVAAGCLLYRNQQNSCRTEAEHKLAAVADLKVSELSVWRSERLADAKVFYKNNAFSALVRRSIERPQDLPLQEELRTWIGHSQVSKQYDRVVLFDAAGNKVMMVSDTGEPLSILTHQKAREALRSGQLTFADFYPNEKTKKVYLRLFVPILDGPSGGRPLGVLMLKIDPNVYLYPLIQRWPTPSETAETLLIRREGNEAVFLNELRFQKNTALTLGVPLDSTDLPAVKAALGQEGIVEGVDYRGVPVLAAIRAVPNSPWFLVAKMDAAEVYAPMRERLWLTILFVGVLLFGLAAAVGFLWRHQHTVLYREKYETERKYRNLFESSRDALMTIEPPSWKFTVGNPAMVEMFRLKNAQELTTLAPWELSPERQPDGRASGEKAKEMIETAVREGSHLFEWTHKRIDGEEFPATVLLTRTKQAGKVIVQVTVRDITEQKQAEEKRKKLLVRRKGINELQQSLLELAPPEEKLRKVTDGIVRLFDADFCRIWLIRPGDLCQRECIHAAAEDGPHVCRHRDRCLHLLASSGRYTHIDGQSHRRVPFGCYKIGRIASGEDHKFLTNDAQNDPHVHNHQWAREMGLVSFAGYQIRVPGGETLGVLGLFAKHPIDESEDAMLDGLSSAVALVVQQATIQEALRESEETFRTHVENSFDVIFALNKESEFQFLSPAWERHFGYPVSDAIGKPFAPFVHPDDAPSCVEYLMRVLSTGKSETSPPFRVKRADGQWRWFVANGTSYVDTKGQLQFIGVGRDITDNKQAEEALLEFKTAVEQSMDGIALADLDGHIRFVNEAWARLHGYRVDELIGRHLGIFHTKEQLDTEVNPFNQQVLENGSAEGEVGHARKDGTTFPMWMTVTVLMDAHQKPFELLGIAHDITEQKRTQEQALIFRRFAEASGQGLGMATLQGEILYMNQTLCRMLDEDNLEDVYKKGFSEYYPPESRERLLNEVLPKVMSGGQWVGELALASTKGKQTSTIENFFLIRDEEGMPLRLADVVTDITERKQMEDDLRKAKDAAEAANRAKSEFLANMSHEIRTPMTAILGYADLMLDENVGRTTREHVAVIKRNGEHLLKVIGDILDLSKIEAGKLQIEPTRYSPVQVVSEVVSLMRAQAVAKQLKLKTELAQPLPETVLTDPLRLRQVLVNLVGNAIKFTDQGEVRLAVRLNADSGRLGLCFDVTDTGIGMNEEQIGKLFKPFSQVDNSSTRKFGGTGLGLCISKHLAEALGGSIEVRSEPGKGSTFSLTIDPGAAGRDAHDTECPRGPARSHAISDRGNPGEDHAARPNPPGRGWAG